jgi:hypothetical protein
MCGKFLIQSKQASLEAEREVALFHQRFESAQYDAIYGDAAPDFQVTIQPPKTAGGPSGPAARFY